MTGRRVGASKEAPEAISGLAAWYDARATSTITTATGVSSWTSRAGSMGPTALTQGTAANQAAYATGVGVLGNQAALQFDGTNDSLGAATAGDWTFLHDNTGSTLWMVLRIDSTGGANQCVVATATGVNTQTGIRELYGATSISATVANGSGTAFQNTWSIATAAHYARDTSRWHAWTHGSNTRQSAVSGSTISNADVGGQVASTGAPSNVLRVGALPSLASFFKGYIAQLVFYKRVLTAGELSSLGAWAAQQYGVSA